ncbi:MAG TPA: beta-ketoacyl-[acyl-carrier-protein] synthase family protein [Thermoanaerobaculia bacterium]|nr:beta-ketoacyl-[acyl-carrier-protein] synthase family protein [Thermoanaerobaculia bacterium]
MPAADRRVALTGAGVISSLGTDVDGFWRHCLEGRTVVEEIPAAWALHSPLRSRAWSPLGAWERETPLMTRIERKQLDPASRIALLAAEEALRRAGLPLESADPRRNAYRIASVDGERAGVFLGTGVGGLHSCLESSRFIVLDQPRRSLRELEMPAAAAAVLEGLAIPRAFNPFSVAMTMPNASAAALSIKLGLTGPCRTFAGACASGTVALGQAFRAVRQGECDLALAGGVEFLSDPFGCAFRGFDAVGALAAGPLPPDRINRPFDRERCGFLFSEGGGAVLVLEDLERARRRGADVLAEIVGYGETADAYHLMGMAPEGRQIRRALDLCLADAGLAPADVGYINAHGTGTPANDAVEARVLAELFPRETRVNSTKSLLGHTLGASGAIEALVAALTLRDGVAHPSRNLTDPEFPLAFIRQAEPVAARYAISESFAFGGQNAALALASAALRNAS